MKIKNTSSIYRFQRDAWVSEGAQYISSNLCPYMRRFIRLLIGTCVAFTTVIIVGVGLIAAPLYLAFGDSSVGLGGYFAMYVGVGFGAWFIVITAGIIWGFNRLFSKKYAVRRAVDQFATQYIAEPIKRVVKRNIFVQWYNAVHDKICPVLEFVESDK